MLELNDKEMAEFQAIIYRISGMRINETKKVLLSSRILRRLRATGIATFGEYLKLVQSVAGRVELDAMIDAVTTNETFFFRHDNHFAWMETYLKDLSSQVMQGKRPKKLHIWSAACSTGEEPYSIAMMLLENRLILNGWELKIFATDICSTVLETARKGRYQGRTLEQIPLKKLKRYFKDSAEAGFLEVKPEVVEMVEFSKHNLMQVMIPPRQFDLVFLRNVLIYFDKDSKAKVLDRIGANMASDGYLVMGVAEDILGCSKGLRRIQPWLYQKEAG
ncbi:MAG: protein-glutamate O-methyltransferase CheR [Planctomycetes bacterium]|nr:protein-glutamate O-methyltransferase CheR [Planctomycetota bacterium]NBY00865.1 protein-glutamate O-methyltransferase CheR [Planctomycetota bacterium]